MAAGYCRKRSEKAPDKPSVPQGIASCVHRLAAAPAEQVPLLHQTADDSPAARPHVRAQPFLIHPACIPRCEQPGPWRRGRAGGCRRRGGTVMQNGIHSLAANGAEDAAGVTQAHEHAPAARCGIGAVPLYVVAAGVTQRERRGLLIGAIVRLSQSAGCRGKGNHCGKEQASRPPAHRVQPRPTLPAFNAHSHSLRPILGDVFWLSTL
jgi:hypothetical protein